MLLERMLRLLSKPGRRAVAVLSFFPWKRQLRHIACAFVRMIPRGCRSVGGPQRNIATNMLEEADYF